MGRQDGEPRQPSMRELNEALGVQEAELIHVEMDPLTLGGYTVCSSNFNILREFDEVRKEYVDCLTWFEDFPHFGHEPRDRKPLADFLLLAEARSDQILGFAARYGALGVYPTIGEGVDERLQFPCRMQEPLDFYRRLAWQFGALLHLADDQEQGKHLDVSDWHRIDAEVASWGTSHKDYGTEDRQIFVRKVLSKWLRIANPLLSLSLNPPDGHMYRFGQASMMAQGTWDRQQFGWQTRKMPPLFDNLRRPSVIQRHADLHLPSVSQRPSELFTFLVALLVSVITSPRGVRHCSACNRLIGGRARRPARNKSAYCENEECQAQSTRDRSKRHYDMKKRPAQQ